MSFTNHFITVPASPQQHPTEINSSGKKAKARCKNKKLQEEFCELELSHLKKGTCTMLGDYICESDQV